MIDGQEKEYRVLLGYTGAMRYWDLHGGVEWQFLCKLATHKIVYVDDITGTRESARVFKCHAQRKLEQLAIVIQVIYNKGYYLIHEDRKALKEFIISKGE
jgi:hypothetical protein